MGTSRSRAKSAERSFSAIPSPWMQRSTSFLNDPPVFFHFIFQIHDFDPFSVVGISRIFEARKKACSGLVSIIRLVPCPPLFFLPPPFSREFYLCNGGVQSDTGLKSCIQSCCLYAIPNEKAYKAYGCQQGWHFSSRPIPNPLCVHRFFVIFQMLFQFPTNTSPCPRQMQPGFSAW